jgi:hypothetical protein
MHPKLPSIILAAMLGAALLALPGDARACSCAGDGFGPYKAVPDYDVVFRGTVKELAVPQVLESERMHLVPPRVDLVLAVWANATVRVVMEVEESWRGVITREIELDVGSGWCCDCSFGDDFAEPGEELLVFAHEREDGTLRVSTCTPPIRIADAEDTLAAFGPGRPAVVPGRKGRTDEHDLLAILQVVIIVFGVALVLAALAILRRSGAEAA